ncbi:DUF3667 domain-containing protein [Qipengyuania atrilutea]|uniref:DUF3667 domain-containing protein n=1 Tax=Qipengyuania atrilutea TaxID=2744473 RepID=A0A850H6K8_9SPHN|nr:DUF3667 domain-containing protein [Actirhodobacter atriluteus]NVD44815.1 DUF3667 domain-containing protein [Actirhodobacter atriluteus]
MNDEHCAASKKRAGPIDGSGHFHSERCLNCGAPLTGPHCRECGQDAHLPRSIHAVAHDFTHGVLHLDGKFWDTLGLLVAKPGKLSRRYIDGERKKFVSPFSMFLFSVFALFLVLQVLGINFGAINAGDMVTPALRQAEMSLEEIARGESDLGVSEIARIEEVAGAEQASEAEDTLERLESDRRDRAVAARTLVSQALEEWSGEEDGGEAREPALRSESNETINRLGALIDEKISMQPAVFATKMQANLYKFSWLLIPLSLPFVWLLFFWRREFGLYEHAVFVTYSIAFTTLLLSLALVLARLGMPSEFLVTTIVLGIPVHHALQLRGTYGLSKRSTLTRLFILEWFVVIVLMLFLTILLALGVL